jgi:septal ring factor EnvC (AmiA/AmiB activator)
MSGNSNGTPLTAGEFSRWTEQFGRSFTEQMNGMRTDVRDLSTKVETQGKEVAVLGSEMRRANTRLREVEQNVDEHGDAITVLETQRDDAHTHAARSGRNHGGAWGAIGGLLGGFVAGLLSKMTTGHP